MEQEPPELPARRIAHRPPDDARAQLSNLHGVLVLSALMFDGRDAVSILELATDAVSSLGAFQTVATYRTADRKVV
ncbi:MAG: hypothetical protein U1C73_08445, partial [Dietzia sp.]|nr:hypothetical protein [Dietzia sp.]